MYHFEPLYTDNVFSISKAIGFLDQNEVMAMYEVLNARLKQLDAAASLNFNAGDMVRWFHKKHTRIYTYTGKILTVGPNCKIITSTGAQWTIPSRMLSKV